MFKALKEGFCNIFKPPATIKYPAEPIILDEQMRGLIEYDKEKCIFCYKCEKVCPPKAIIFERNRENKKESKYFYNPYLCIYCSECVRSCPKAGEALWQENSLSEIGTKETIEKLPKIFN